jgi:PAS domain S-box-containing protein
VPRQLINCRAASAISVPIRALPHAAGALTAFTRAHREFSHTDLLFARAVADVIAAAWRDDWSRRELRESEARFRGIFEQAAVGIARVGLDGRWLQFNPAMCRITGYPAEELAELRINDVIHPDDLGVDLAHLADLSAGRADSYTMDKRYVRRDGSLAWVSLARSVVRDANGGPLYYVSVIEDVSDRRRAEQAARDGEARMRAVVDTAVDAIITIDTGGLIESANPAACALFGYALSELVGRNVSLLMPEPYAGEHDGYVRNYLLTGLAKIMGIGRDVTGLRRDGTVFPAHLGVSTFTVGGRQMFAGVLRDLTEQRRLEREIIEIGAEEQRRIGQDLHDGLCQELTGVSFALEVLGQKLANRLAPETGSIRKVAELVDQSIGHARTLAHGLQPVTLDASGLTSALRDLAAKVEDTDHVSCMFVCDSDVLVHDNVVATHVFRIAQEAIGNAIKHGKARTIVLDLSAADGCLRLTVSDDGVGLGAATSGDGNGIGLQTMAYRARVVGGQVEVRGGEKGGTVVSCAVPLRGMSGWQAGRGANDDVGDDEGAEERIAANGRNVEAKEGNAGSVTTAAGEQRGDDSRGIRTRGGSTGGSAGAGTRSRGDGKRTGKAKGIPRRRPSDGA